MQRLIAKIATSFFFILFLWFAGLVWFIAQIPERPTQALPQADAIVVLTGGAGRLEYGIELLLVGKGEKLFVSGANEIVTHRDLIAIAPDKKREQVRKLTKKYIILGNNAENTIGNAEETKSWLESQTYKSLLLVTSSYHMPRSLSEFKELMPGMQITPAPVITSNFKADWIVKKEIRNIVLSEYHKYLISKFRHWFIRSNIIHIV